MIEYSPKFAVGQTVYLRQNGLWRVMAIEPDCNNWVYYLQNGAGNLWRGHEDTMEPYSDTHWHTRNDVVLIKGGRVA